jgi:DNA topoisomerase I
MPDNLVVVESPAKARTIKKYLGRDFEVLASYGHVRDLVPKEGAVDPSHGFRMRYQVLEKNQRHVEAIARALKRARALYLATDPDREGEAIAWHLIEILKSRGELGTKAVHRVAFYEITRNAIREAIANPRGLSAELVNAQQARRALDYLVGFNLSPLLWKKVRRGLSAGRVQSPALRMICEREEEIAAFQAREYWTLDGQGSPLAAASEAQQPFALKLSEYRGRKVEQFSFENETSAREAERTIRDAAAAAAPAGVRAGALGELTVLAIERKQRRRNPAPPFTTSSLQQEAARKLGFNARRTMRLAQQLYEGVDVGEGNVGLITYMRTDSVSLAAEAIEEIRAVAARLYGQESVAEEPRQYKTKSKNAQEAHEAIRPTSAAITPADIEGRLDEDLYRLYSLIWRRAVASQMSHALYDTVAVDLLAGPDGPTRHLLRANGSTLVKPGFIAVYQEGADDAKIDEDDHVLPPLNEGDRVRLIELSAQQHFTEPPPRFTEASLVKALEEHGIGRPSTYATIISTLQDREYVEMDAKRFVPTDVGKIVSRFLTNHFNRYVDYGFTAEMEDELDAVSRGEEEWTIPLSKFWKPFIRQVVTTDKNVSREEVAQARELGKHPESGKPVTVRMGRYGPFVQIGTKDDAEKPRFAGLRPGQKMDRITLEEGLELFKLPRELGATPAGETIVAAIGRFGPYLKYGAKYVSLKEDDPYTVSLERAREVIRLKQEADANRIITDFGTEGIQVLNGRYGPYATDGKKNAKIPKERDPKSLTLEECRAMIAAAPERGRFGRRRVGAGAAAAGAAPPAQPAATSADAAPGARPRRTPRRRAEPAGTQPAADVTVRPARRTSVSRRRPAPAAGNGATASAAAQSAAARTAPAAVAVRRARAKKSGQARSNVRTSRAGGRAKPPPPKPARAKPQGGTRRAKSG